MPIPIHAVVFDMDGLLVDSEPLWGRAEVECFSTIGLTLTIEETRQTAGLRIDEVTDYWYACRPWYGPSPAEMAETITHRLIELVRNEGTLLPGAREALAHVRERNLLCGLATSSSTPIIDATLDTFELRPYFDAVRSAEHEPYGKPHPAVYIGVADDLRIPPLECVALEDSVNGTLAACAARMRCVAVPAPEQRDDRRFGIADAVLESLHGFPAALDRLAR